MTGMKARREFYTVVMNVGEGIQGYCNRVRNLGENLKAMGGEVTGTDVSMSALNGLTSKYESLLVDLDAKGADELSVDFFNSRILQEERRQADTSPAIKPVGDAALVGANYRGQRRRYGSSKIECYYRHTFGHIFQDFPVLEDRNKGKDKLAAIVADDRSDSDDAICLVGNAYHNDENYKSCLVDSAASAYMCWMRACFEDYKATTVRSVTMDDNGSVATAAVGTVVLNVIAQRKRSKINLEKVLHVPTMGFSLVSVGMMEERGAEVSFKGGKAIIKISDNIAACGTRKSGLYHLDMAPLSNVSAVAFLQLWQEHFGHVNVAGVERMSKNKKNDGLKCSSMAVKNVCEPCVYGKAEVTPTPSAGGGRVSERLLLVYSGMGGPMSEPSRGGARYFGTFTEEFSCWTCVVFFNKMSDLPAEYEKWLTKVHLHTGNNNKVLRSDNGGEYVSTTVEALHVENSTTHQTTVPDMPQQNGVSKRLNRVLVEMTRIMLRHKDADQDLWADAIKPAVHMKNLGTSRVLSVSKASRTLWTGNEPDVSHMRVFRSTCWVVLHKSHIDGTFGDKSAKGVL